MVLFGFILSLFWTIFFIKVQNKFKAKREKFVKFLENEKDLDTLYRIGEYNKLGLKERRRAGGRSFLLKKYDETGIEEYYHYAEEGFKSFKILLVYFFLIFFGLCAILSFLTWQT
jgi:hypothetical protein